MQFIYQRSSLVLPAIGQLAAQCRSQPEFRRKFPKYYDWLRANKSLPYLDKFLRHSRRGRRKLTSQQGAESRARRKVLLLKWRQKPENRLAQQMRVRVYSALKGNLKSDSTLALVGCSPAELKKYLESLFKAGMNWNNYGAWHVDHKRPCASFNLSLPEQQRECFHFTNLQPLWAEENLKKNCKHYRPRIVVLNIVGTGAGG